MFDYYSWINRAALFSETLNNFAPFFGDLAFNTSIYPPITKSELLELTSKTELFIPKALSDFWLQACQFCDFSYQCGDAKDEKKARILNNFFGQNLIYGGARFLNALDLPEHLDGNQAWAEETWIAEYPEEKAFWMNSIPIVSMGNGDYLALDISNNLDDPPIIYLSHDDESSIIAPSFTDFLFHWEKLCYIGPEIWIIRSFRDENGYINSDSNNAEQLRDIFSLS